MASYFFSLPDVYFGENAIQTLRRLNHKKVAIVTDSFMVSSGKTRDLINEMPQACVSIFSEVKPDPSVEILHAGAAQFKVLNRRSLSRWAAAPLLMPLKGSRLRWKSSSPATP
jgi:alcohol dehydrogenase class IV